MLSLYFIVKVMIASAISGLRWTTAQLTLQRVDLSEFYFWVKAFITAYAVVFRAVKSNRHVVPSSPRHGTNSASTGTYD